MTDQEQPREWEKRFDFLAESRTGDPCPEPGGFFRWGGDNHDFDEESCKDFIRQVEDAAYQRGYAQARKDWQRP
jgi:hypothetical protein